MGTFLRHAAISTALCLAAAPALAAGHPDRLLWGDTHLHTNLSVDAYLLRNTSAGADEAYRFASGEPVIHPYHRARVQLHTPLDFLAVTDHAELLGVPYRLLEVRDKSLTATRLGRQIKTLVDAGRNDDAFGLFVLAINAAGASGDNQPKRLGLLDLISYRFRALIGPVDQVDFARRWLGGDPTLIGDLNQEQVIRTSWESNLAAAERYNRPGAFTTLVGWEYTPTPDGANLHRIILSSTDGATARGFMPFSSNESPNPEDLWRWLQKTAAATDADFVSIPHNSNISKGRMFAAADFSGAPLTAELAQLRADYEMVAEVTQIKGTSETHPLLSPNDEFAGFEFFAHLIEAREDAEHDPTVTRADYVRGALLTGLEEERRIGVNPFKLGMIGSTDSHSGLAGVEEDNFTGKFAFDSTPETKGPGPGGRITGWSMSASGLAAVWANDNTRPEILAAFKRREVYGTTGTRIALRFFGGYDYAPSDANAADIAVVGYAKGVPMGGDLTRASDGRAPTFLVHAAKDPIDANLDRIQIVKGWLGPDGKTQEKVFDVVWAGDRRRGADGRLSPIGDTVDRRTGAYRNSIGASQLAAVWSDPEFDPAARAFYYARVLQIPTPRSSLLDSIALGQPSPAGFPEVIQERAYSSPIWYAP